MSAASIIQIAQTVGALQQLSTLLDPQNGQSRWNLLQDWLAKNPSKRKMIETAASLPPSEALGYLLDQIGVDIETLRGFDPMGQITAKAEIALAELQKLYNERKSFDATDGRRINSPGKKRKKKAIQAENAFESMNDLPIMEGEIIK